MTATIKFIITILFLLLLRFLDVFGFFQLLLLILLMTRQSHFDDNPFMEYDP